jgi:hypothetical protein
MTVYFLPVTLVDGSHVYLPVAAATRTDAYEQRHDVIADNGYAANWMRIDHPVDADQLP